MKVKKEMWMALACALGMVACAADDPPTGAARQGLTESDLWTALDVQDLGPTDRPVGIVSFGGYSRFATDLHNMRAGIGLDDVSATIVDENNGMTYPTFDLSGAKQQAKLAQGLAITGISSPVVVAQANSTSGADFGHAIDALVAQGCKTIVGAQEMDSTAMTDLQPRLRAAHTAGVQIVWTMGALASGNGFQTATPEPVGATDANGNPIVLGVAITDIPQAGETVYSGSKAAASRGADFAVPASASFLYLPASSTTTTANASVQDDPAFAAGLGGGIFVRDLSLQVPGDLTAVSGRFGDVTLGNDGTSCSPSSACTAGTGKDGPSGWGVPDVATFGTF